MFRSDELRRARESQLTDRSVVLDSQIGTFKQWLTLLLPDGPDGPAARTTMDKGQDRVEQTNCVRFAESTPKSRHLVLFLTRFPSIIASGPPVLPKVLSFWRQIVCGDSGFVKLKFKFKEQKPGAKQPETFMKVT